MITKATLRNGDVIEMGEEVETRFHPSCEGKTFVICGMTEYPYCESGVLVVVHLKGDPDRKIKGLQVEDNNGKWPDGIDSNHFIKIKKTK